MPNKVKQRSRTNGHRSPKAPPESAGGRTVTFQSSAVASTPADPLDAPAPDLRATKASSRKKSLRSAGGAAEPVSAEKNGAPKNTLNEHIICEHPPADPNTLDEILEECERLEDNRYPEPLPQGVAQLEEPAARIGEDAGSNPVSLIEPPQGQLKGDPPLHEGAIVAPPAAPYAGGTHEIEPSAEAALPIAPPPKKRIVATYEYTDEVGNYLWEVVRYEPKDFRPRRRIGKNKYEWSLEGVRRVPYRLHDFATADGLTVFVVEGEKDVETARRLGLIATCSSGGANGWKPKFAEFLHRHRVVILPDNDEPGADYAEIVATSIDDIARDYRIVHLPGLPPKGDLTDFVQAGGTKDDIDRLVAKAFASPRAQKRSLYDTDPHPDHSTNGTPSQPAQLTWSVRMRCFADIEKEPIDWLWKGVWINHSLNVLIGKAGVGKTYLAAYLAAAISRGSSFPDGGGVAPLGDVVYCTTEGNLGSQIRPRLEEAGADLKRVFTWDCLETVDRSGEQVEKGISLADIASLIRGIDRMPDLRLIIFDPALGFMAGTEANDNQDVRVVLEEIGKLCFLKRICVLLLHHTKKGVTDASDSALGAGAFTQVPRAVWTLLKDPDSSDKTARCLSPIKMNEAADTHGKTFRLAFDHGIDGPGHVIWDAAPDERSANELMSAAMLKNCAAGRASYEEKSSVQSEVDFFEVLGALEKPAGTWVPTIEIRRRLGWNGVKFPKVVFQLEKSERIEVRMGDMIMPNGAVKQGGREEVRSKKHGPY